MSAKTATRRRRSGTPAPRPGEIAVQIKVLLGELVRFLAAYRYAHIAGYGPAVTGDGGRRADVSDPTGNLAASPARDRPREACRQAHANLTEALAAIRSATYVLDRVMTAIDPPPSANLRHEDQYRVGRAELAASKAAQDRRAGRGEGFGES